ncbi:uncharacterized protein HKW66_Vig0010700 [Vigna angularis]|uniref:Uncharacterized protein n=1 Tax=Phaseolus angularis TaxID=3914 RepID=A0A8T0LIS5_PHAAN|nr:uncharacterized protein HKW66_Vig0010700 [Vigna angularis]
MQGERGGDVGEAVLDLFQILKEHKKTIVLYSKFTAPSIGRKNATLICVHVIAESVEKMSQNRRCKPRRTSIGLVEHLRFLSRYYQSHSPPSAH